MGDHQLLLFLHSRPNFNVSDTVDNLGDATGWVLLAKPAAATLHMQESEVAEKWYALQEAR